MSRADSTGKQQLEQLFQIRALLREMASAISAIEKNDLRQLESHVAAQEAVCNSVVSAQKLLSPGPASLVPASDLDSGTQLLAELRQAHVELAQLNRVYAAVLKRAERMVGLVASIYRAHGQGYDRNLSPIAKQHTWSCEA